MNTPPASSIIAVGSIKGTGGATSTALGLASAAGELTNSAVLMEADPSGGSLLGWSEHLNAARPSLYDAASQQDLQVVMQRLGQISVVPAQGDPWKITVALEGVRRWRPLLQTAGDVMVVDVGRLYPSSPTLRIAGEADVLVLVCPPEASPLAATIEWMVRGGQRSSTDTSLDPARLRLVTVDATTSKRSRIDPKSLLREDLGVAYAGHVPFDDAALSLLCRGTGL
ncbi:MAG: hypothetical protein AAFP84_21975, partial [Actinomycetota bacterium]